ncbi:hypothetical protein HW35_14795 [Bacillus sp. X1(2014)]|nr:hypothetical protein HW35_14795 [Bacillus sp. X1(2014)]
MELNHIISRLGLTHVINDFLLGKLYHLANKGADCFVNWMICSMMTISFQPSIFCFFAVCILYYDLFLRAYSIVGFGNLFPVIEAIH